MSETFSWDMLKPPELVKPSKEWLGETYTTTVRFDNGILELTRQDNGLWRVEWPTGEVMTDVEVTITIPPAEAE